MFDAGQSGVASAAVRLRVFGCGTNPRKPSMTILSWHDQYLIGNSVIDDEHKELFRLINEFHSKWTETRDRQAIKELSI
jgi:hypothetical protein